MQRLWTWIGLAGATAMIAILIVATNPKASTGHAATPTAQTVAVTETDFHIASSQTTFMPGKTYHFVVTNASSDVHEFMIGPPMPMGMSMAQMDALSLVMQSDIAPHQTRSFDVTFPMHMSTSMMNGVAMSKLEMACHLTGHYEAGMLLPITLTASAM